MPKKRYMPEEIIQHLRTVELGIGKGLAVLDAWQKLGITEQTYYRIIESYSGKISTARSASLLQLSPSPG